MRKGAAPSEASRARVCAVGTPAEIDRILREMFILAMDPEDEEIPAPGGLLQAIDKVSAGVGGVGDQFLYEMICPRPWGDALFDSCRLQRGTAPGGLQTLLFTYSSGTAFQAHDWLELHRACGRPLMMALYASGDFSLSQGGVIFAGGKMEELWDDVGFSWLWLFTRYGEGDAADALPDRLAYLARALREEEWDGSASDLAEGCARRVTFFRDRTADAEALAAEMDAAVRAGEFGRVLSVRCAIASAALWDVEHAHEHLAALENLRAALNT